MAITISVTAGSGYFGSTYTHDAVVAGNWYSDENPISGATGSTYVMESVYEGTKITFRTTSPAETSNSIKMFAPNQVAGLLAQWDMSRADLVTITSSAVSLVTSRAGSVSPATWSQATAGNRPTYSATGRNSKPAILTDGTDDFMVVDQTAVSPYLTATSVEISLAFFGAATGNWRVLSAWSNSTTFRGTAKNNLENVAQGGGSGATDNLTTINWNNADHIVIAQDTSAGKVLTVDGGTPLVKSFALNTPTQVSNYMFRGNSAGGNWLGSLQETMRYSVVPSTADLSRIEGYLAWKWGVTALLPGGHTYKSAPPLADTFVGSVAFGNMVVTGLLKFPSIVTGAITFGDMIATGVMRQRFSGAAAFSDMIVTGIMAEKSVVTGAVTFGSMTVTGELAQKLVAVGSIAFSSMIPTGIMAFGGAFTGAAAFGDMITAGALTFTSHHIFDGAAAFDPMSVVGTLTFAMGAAFTGAATFGDMITTGEMQHLYRLDGSVSFITMDANGTMFFTDADVAPILWGEMIVTGEMSTIEPDVIVEDGSVVPDANSYITVSYADYYLGKQGHTDWVTTALEDKISAIIRATLGVDSTYGARYPGTKVAGRAQSLLWPRKDAEDINEDEIPADEVPIEIRKATAEAAYLEWLTPGYLSPNWTIDQLVTQETLGPLSVSYSDPANFGRGGNLPTLTKIDGILYPILGSGAPQLFGTTSRI